ncbi:MAG: DUF3667 domain-containing protein [Kangiellaceae bacterium]
MNQDTLPESTEVSTTSNEMQEDSGYEYCSNCGIQLAGMYCHKCGQSSKSMIKFFGEVVKELLDDTIGYDSRIKHSILPLLFKPGRITLDYIKGKRFYYVLPFRLYLITSLILILLVKAAANTDDLKFDNLVKVKGDQTASQELQDEINQELNLELGELNKALNQKKKSRPNEQALVQQQSNSEEQQELENESDNQQVSDQDIEEQNIKEQDIKEQDDSDSINLDWNSETLQLDGIEDIEESWFKTFLEVINPKLKNWKEDPGPLVDSFFEALPYMMFLILPIFAIFLKVFYAFSKRYYIEHLVFLLHNHAFMYMVMMLDLITEYAADKLRVLDNSFASSIATGLEFLAGLLFYWMFIYVLLAMKRFYHQGWAATIFKTILLAFIYFIMIGIGFMMTLAYGAYQA